jgi:AcrR family transcriptional regulator
MAAEVKRRPRDRKSTIITAAAELFSARGFSAIGIDDIGERVGITGPAIYRHFKGKDALLLAVLLDAVSAYEVDAQALERGLRRVVADTVTTALDNPAGLATYVRERHRLTGDDRSALATAERGLRVRWRKVIALAHPELDSRRIADRYAATLAALSGIALRAPAINRPQLDRLLVDALVALITAPVIEPPPAPTEAREWSPTLPRSEVIFQQALALFHRRGFHGVGIDDIGDAAGITGPSVYFYYDNKQNILVNAFERSWAFASVVAYEALARADSAQDALSRLIYFHLVVVSDNVDLFAVTIRESRALPDQERRRRSRQRVEIRDAWATVIRELRPELSEGAVRTLIIGAFPLMIQLVERGVTPEEAHPLIVAFLLGSDATLPPPDRD